MEICRPLDVYDYCKDVDANLAKFNITKGSTENEKTYFKNVTTYALFIQQEAQLLMQYLDTPSTSM